MFSGPPYLACNEKNAFFPSLNNNGHVPTFVTLHYHVDNALVRFGSELCKQILGISMGTNYTLIFIWQICFVMREASCGFFAEYSLKLKIKRNDWLLACGHVSSSSQSLRSILSLRMNSSFITSRPGPTHYLQFYGETYSLISICYIFIDTLTIGTASTISVESDLGCSSRV